MAFEDNIKNAVFGGKTDKSFLDKLFTKEEAERIKELIKKHPLTREELLELLYMVIGVESKLWNLSEWDRYISLKFFVWIREFIKLAELMHDFLEFKDKKIKSKKWTLNERMETIMDKNRLMIEHNCKFLIDLYLNINRTTLSLGSTGFLEALKNKYEFMYSNPNQINTPTQPGVKT